MKPHCEHCCSCNCHAGLCEIERILRRPPPIVGPVEITLLFAIAALGVLAFIAMAHALPADFLS